LAEAAGAVEAAIAGEGKLDAHKLRADFPIFEQRFHGKRNSSTSHLLLTALFEPIRLG